jgi:EmrB/QacA subfamily drug resistance transporter
VTSENRKWWTLGAVTAGLFMVMLDGTVVNVALPTISRDLHMSMSSLEWIVNGYTLSFAMLILTGGKLADFFGRRLFYLVGLVVFSLASLACGLASGGGVLIGARVVQGAGAALLMPATLSIITATFPHEERGTAIGIWAGVSAIALALGPLVGGLVTEHLHWSWIFFLNVPVGALGVLATLAFVDESKDTAAEQRLDLAGLALAAIGVFALTYALIDSNKYGWGSTRIVVLFVVSAGCLAGFVALEAHERLPMLRLSLFRSRVFSGANTVALLVALALFGIIFYLSLYMQNILGYSAVKTGVAELPETVLIGLTAPIAGKLTDRFGPRLPVASGTALLALSLYLFSRLGVHSHYAQIVPGLLVGGVGVGLTMGPTTVAVLSAVPVDDAGVGSGVISTFRQTGGALGVALFGAIVAAAVSVPPFHPSYAQQFVDGLQNALLVGAGLSLLGTVVALLTTGSKVAGRRSQVVEFPSTAGRRAA